MSCSEDQTESNTSLADIAKKLSAAETFPAQQPFQERAFKPFLDDKWIGNAISYGCYRKGQAPGVKGPSEAEILEDLQILGKYWQLIRVYGSDDDAERILKVIRQNNLPIKVMLGIWLENETDNPAQRQNNIRQTLRGIELAREYENEVIAVSVGNETQVFWSFHRMNADDLIRYIRAVRSNVRQPVTTADDYNFWNKPASAAIAAEVDFVVTHMYALWNGITLDKALSWTDSVYTDIQTMHPDKQIVIGETGWATRYNPDKKGPGEQGSLVKGEVSLKAQETFLTQLHQWIIQNKVTTFWFEAFDEPWKGGGEQSGPDEIEKHWGLFYENRTPKPSFQNFLKTVQHVQLSDES
jgi:exo-beta-1,3-glucanase (GH17 family)